MATMRVSVILVFGGFCTAACEAGVAWHAISYLDGGGYWPSRTVLTVSSPVPVNGTPQTIRIGTGADQVNLVGAEAHSIRVLDEAGNELLYGLNGPGGEPRRTGALKAGDELTVPVECPANESRKLIAYFGNPRAGELPDFLSGGFANGGFETGEEEPTAWAKLGADSDHTLAWVTDNPHSGKRCVKAGATEQAESSWFKYIQAGIPVTPGQQYELRGWVRAESVKGSAGWYVHVNGIRPQMINQVLNGGEGTYGWKELILRFTVPEGGATADVGTVLYGTGSAWYDDCSLTAAETGPTARVTCGPVESLELREIAARGAWLQETGIRVPLRVFNLDAEPHRGALISADLRRALLVARTGQKPMGVRVHDAATSKEAPVLLDGSKLTFQADLPAKSASTFHGYVVDRSATQAAPKLNVDALVVGPKNRVINPDFEEGGDLPTQWDLSAQRADGKVSATGHRVAGGKSGNFCAEMTIPKEAEPSWSGWHQFVPVEPSGTYFLGAWMKTKAVDGSVTLYAHVRNAEKQLVSANAYLGTSPALSGTTDWTWTQTVATVPADARFIELHLTMNAHGTVWHDGLVVKRLADTMPARVLGLESAPLKGLALWRVNPMIKVFRDEPTGAPSKAVVVHLARNEREPVQLVLKSDRAVKGLKVSVTPLTGVAGQALPPVEVARVGYVPVDWPTNYYSINVPTWRRKIPTGTPSCDGWVGDWPDPLPPVGQLSLEPGEAQPVWLTVHAPENATPGVYRGEVTIAGPGIKRVLPLTVTVRSFMLPRRPSLQITYDGHVSSGEEGRQWYRFMAEHRASPGFLPDLKMKLMDNGEVQMDFAEFDKMASYCFDELGMSTMYTPWHFYALGWAYSPRKFLGLQAFTPEWEKAFGSAYRLYTNHLQQKGWLDRIVLYLSDEPFGDRKEVIANLQRFSKFAQSIAPKVPVYSSTWRHMPDLNGAVTLWGAGHYGGFPVERINERLVAGDRVWFTTDGQQCLDTPYAGTERMLAWYCFKYGVQGFEFWGVNWYTYDPWKFGWHNFIQQANSEKEAAYWVRYPNGDGYLAYPGKPVGVGGPVSSLRLEAVRDGEEDYEYLLLLRQRIEAARKAGKEVGTAESVLHQALDLISIPNPGGLRTSECIKDPGEVLRMREKLAEQIEALK